MNLKSESIKELAIALTKAQPKIKSALKDAANPFFKSKYADLSSIWHACREALNENDLTIVQTISADRTLDTLLIHSSGEWIQGSCPLILNPKVNKQTGEVLEPGMQELGSAISYARRYSIAAICGVVTEDDDANAADQKPIPPRIPPQPTMSTGSNEARTEKPVGGSSPLISESQGKMVYAKCKSAGMANNKEISDFLSATIGVFNTAHIPRKDLDKVLEALEKRKDVGDIPF